jgi:2-polyprenyl-3-methyl-5-hydroxy-6-metoxy-1,4-benzoquinol methylase
MNKKYLREFYEDEAQRLSHQEMMYFKADKHTIWWHRKRLRYILTFLFKALEENPSVTVVDAGCAEGFYVKRVSSIYSQAFCIGLDIARSYLRKAKIGTETLNVDYIACDVENLPFKDGSVDVLICSEVLEHVPNYREAIMELLRVGKKHLILSFPGHSLPYRLLIRLGLVKKLAAKLSSDVGHISEVSVKDVLEIAKGKQKCVFIKIGGALPLQLFKIVFSVRVVEVVDNLLCSRLERLGAFEHATIHVMWIVKR